MLYDNRHETLPPPVELEPWRKALLDAADLLDKRGWCQYAAQGKNGICAARAIFEVMRLSERGYRPVAEKFEQYLGLTPMGMGGMSIPPWNDTRGRTKEQVQAALRAAAAA